MVETLSYRPWIVNRILFSLIKGLFRYTITIVVVVVVVVTVICRSTSIMGIITGKLTLFSCFQGFPLTCPGIND